MTHRLPGIPIMRGPPRRAHDANERPIHSVNSPLSQILLGAAFLAMSMDNGIFFSKHALLSRNKVEQKKTAMKLMRIAGIGFVALGVIQWLCFL